MSDDALTDLLQRAHDGEVLGEALFASLAAGAEDADERRKLEACRLLEEQTRATIASLARDLGVALADADDHAEVGRRGAEALAAMGWTDRMAAVADGTGVYRSLYGDLEAALPDATDPRLAEIIGHEHALTGFARAEASGDPAALDGLLAALSSANRARLAAASD
jgi:hypothetical protein